MELEIRNITKRFGGIVALNGVNLTLSGNELVGLIGPNGSGKTTMVNTIGGIHDPEGGQILLDGTDIAQMRPHQVARRGIGRTFQVTRAFRRMTVLENLLVPGMALAPERGRRAWEERAREVLSFLTMSHLRDDYARSLSGGQQKLLELGQVMMTDPDLILLDEPFAGVHPRLMKTIFDYIKTLHREGKAFIIVSHDMDSIFTLSERLVVLSYGDIIADGDPAVVKNDETVIEAYLGEEERRKPLLEVNDLYVGYYKDLNILQGVDVRARTGQITAVLGANGVGKSTLLKAIYGFIQPQQGEILVDGDPVTHLSSHELVHHGVSYIPQRQSVFPFMTVEENMELGAWSFRNDTARVQEKLEANYERFPILKQRRRSPAGELSGGMQRMVELGRVMMTNPKLILVDEPTAGLAVILANEIYQLLVDLRNEGITVLLVDQNIRQAIKIADYVYVLELGRNRHEGPRDEFDDLKKALWL